MGDVAKTGRTIIFVSHQMTQIRRLCERVLWLDGGEIRHAGRTGELIAAYETEMMGGSAKNEGDASEIFIGWQLGSRGTILKDGLTEVTFHFAVNRRNQSDEGISDFTSTMMRACWWLAGASMGSIWRVGCSKFA